MKISLKKFMFFNFLYTIMGFITADGSYTRIAIGVALGMLWHQYFTVSNLGEKDE